METYLEAVIPEELCQHLFLSFLKRPSGKAPAPSPVPGNVKDVAAVASQTACAPAVGQSTDALLQPDPPGTPSSSRLPHQVLAEKLHGLTGKIKGHSRTDSGGGSDAERRSRAGMRHAALGGACWSLFMSGGRA